MNVTPEVIVKAKELAEKNYSTWGQYIVECYTDNELAEELADHKTLAAWVKTRKAVASVYAEREMNW